ncbi:hypothetical protein BDR26DRAFT_866959 [Obelidium mucronatum]|nr:hypothetical protein BDR26DRAFT_866959 [Obelidium mucronatum]
MSSMWTVAELDKLAKQQMASIDRLETQVKELRHENTDLREENERLQQQIRDHRCPVDKAPTDPVTVPKTPTRTDAASVRGSKQNSAGEPSSSTATNTAKTNSLDLLECKYKALGCTRVGFPSIRAYTSHGYRCKEKFEKQADNPLKPTEDKSQTEGDSANDEEPDDVDKPNALHLLECEYKTFGCTRVGFPSLGAYKSHIYRCKEKFEKQPDNPLESAESQTDGDSANDEEPDDVDKPNALHLLECKYKALGCTRVGFPSLGAYKSHIYRCKEKFEKQPDNPLESAEDESQNDDDSANDEESDDEESRSEGYQKRNAKTSRTFGCLENCTRRSQADRTKCYQYHRPEYTLAGLGVVKRRSDHLLPCSCGELFKAYFQLSRHFEANHLKDSQLVGDSQESDDLENMMPAKKRLRHASVEAEDDVPIESIAAFEKLDSTENSLKSSPSQDFVIDLTEDENRTNPKLQCSHELMLEIMPSFDTIQPDDYAAIMAAVQEFLLDQKLDKCELNHYGDHPPESLVDYMVPLAFADEFREWIFDELKFNGFLEVE